MITSLNIKNFKSIADENFELKNFNLLAGTNSSGKSSVIQGLLLAADNITETDGNVKNMTAAHLPAISFNESRNFITNAKSYSVSLASGDHSVTLKFLPKDDAFIATVVEQDGILPKENMESVRNIFHLSAMRSGDLGAPKINPNPDLTLLGVNGEYLIHYFNEHKKDVLPSELITDKLIRTFEGQVNHWLRQLAGYTMTVNLINSEYVVRYVTPEGKSLHPYNVGTGVNFIAETLIACLASKPGDTVIIENPEIHLHPAAQAAVLDFLVYIARAGVQVIVESHSDHFFNGIRRSLKQGAISTDKIAIYNFTKQSGLTKTDRVNLSPYGGIENYIPGMFEQFDIDLDSILL